MSIIRVGTTKSYSDGWEVAFGRKKAGGKAAVKIAKPAKRSAKGKKGTKKK